MPAIRTRGLTKRHGAGDGAVVLLAWFAVPIAIGYRRFERADPN